MAKFSTGLFALITLALSQLSLQAPSNITTHDARATCDTYVVNGVTGGFRRRIFVDFSGVTAGGDAVAFLNSHSIGVSNYPISSGPVPHNFSPSNVALANGALNLKVSAYTGSGSIQGAELFTWDQFKYASVRTVQKSSSTPGVVEGNFFYLNDNQEIDWEILTSTIDTSSQCVPAGIWATNQALVPGGSSTHQTVPFTFNPRTSFHEYRIDWSSAATTFYIDGQQKAQLTSNVPTQAGSWLWNVWSNGDPCWSNGPPTADSITQFRSIEIFIDWSSNVSGNVCNV